jgi:hypothetical protein
VYEKSSLLMDNQSAIRLIHNQECHKRLKHIEVRHFFVRNMVKRGDLKVKYVASDHQLVDIFTKPLSKNKLWYFRDKLGMCVCKYSFRESVRIKLYLAHRVCRRSRAM